jgi:hypothetical protein
MPVGSQDSLFLQPPLFCEYAGGACDQSFATLTQSDGFFVFPSEPQFISRTIEEAVRNISARQADLTVTSWRDLHISGRLIFCEICKAVRSAHVTIADVTTLNFNVLFEIGYAIGLGLSVIPIRDTTVIKDHKEFDELGILDTLGFVDFQSSGDLADKLPGAISQARPVGGQFAINTEQPLFFVKSHIHTEGVVRLLSTLKKSGIKFRTFDPRETSRLSLHDVLKQVHSSLAVISHLVSPERVGSAVHNGRSALIAGLAMASQKHTLMLQEGSVEQPIDYRDVIQGYADPAKVPTLVIPFIKRLIDALQPSRFVPTVLPLTALEKIDFGDVAAENEISSLKSYFVPTAQYNDARRGHARLVVGRKGAGKTAIFYGIRNAYWSGHSHLVLDLKPEGHQFTKLREAVLQPLSQGMQEHVLTAFWNYLLLMEIAIKIVRDDRSYAYRGGDSARRYDAVVAASGIVTTLEQGDFSERLLVLVDKIAARRVNDRPVTDILNFTELLYSTDIRGLETALAEYLQKKDGVCLLFDNLDKGWPVDGALPEDLLVLRSLLEATRKLQRQFERKNVEFRAIVFVRNDIYEHLLLATPDKGKDTAVLLDWNDAETFREILRKRLVISTGRDESFDQLWRSYFDTHVNGEESFAYMLSRTLMRPRDLLRFARECVNIAVNRGHIKVLEDDILTGEKTYSEDQLQDVSFELRDVSSAYPDVLYAFIGSRHLLSRPEVYEKLRDAGVPEVDLVRILNLLVWFGFLGFITSDDEGERYSYQFQHRVDRMAVGLKATPVYVIHPAFRVALGCAS